MCFPRITFCQLLLTAILFVAVAACQLPPIESAMFQPISPLAPTAAAQTVPLQTAPFQTTMAQTTLADAQSYRITYLIGPPSDQIRFEQEWVRAEHEWGFDMHLRWMIPEAVIGTFMEIYMIGDDAYGTMGEEPFDVTPRADVIESPFPVTSGLLLKVDDPVQHFPFSGLQMRLAATVEQVAPLGTSEMDGLLATHYQLSGTQAIDLLEPGLRETGQLRPEATLTRLQGDFWLTTDRQYVVRYVIEGGGNGGRWRNTCCSL